MRRGVPGGVARWSATVRGWFRPRPPRDDLPPVDPLPVLRSIIESCDGVDLATVELLAEDEGVERTAVRTALDRLRAIGAVRSERGPDGEEVFAWSHLGAPA